MTLVPTQLSKAVTIRLTETRKMSARIKTAPDSSSARVLAALRREVQEAAERGRGPRNGEAALRASPIG